MHARAREQFMLQDLNPGLRTTTSRTGARSCASIRPSASVHQPINAGEIDYDALEVGCQAPRHRLLVPGLVHARPLAREHHRRSHSR